MLILVALAFSVMMKLIHTKDGILRKIMIFYFAAEIIMLLGFIILELNYGNSILKVTQWVILITLLPKSLVKISFYNHIK